MEPEVERKLVALLSADAVGYSRLMAQDDLQTVRTLTAYRDQMAKLIRQYRGRVVDSPGDNLLAEFPSVLDATRSALEIQRLLTERNAELSTERAMQFRLGVHLGDVMAEGERIYGDGVNVAARLEGLAEPGGICISDLVYRQIRNKLDLGFEDLGEQSLKNIPEPIRVYRARPAGTGGASPVADETVEQQISFCTTEDGVKIAYASVGAGPPLVRALGWFSNLEMEWKSSDARRFWERLARRHQLVRYDGRGIGLSDPVKDFSPETRVRDLEAVVNALGLDRFALMGTSEGGDTAVNYASRNPERVSHLIAYGCPVRGNTPEFRERGPMFLSMIEQGWGNESPVYRQFFANLFLGANADPKATRFFGEMQRASASAETAAAYFRSLGKDDIREAAKAVRVPTLVIHRKSDLMCPFANGRELAALIPGARFVPLEGDQHWLFLKDEDLVEFYEAVEDFLGTEYRA